MPDPEALPRGAPASDWALSYSRESLEAGLPPAPPALFLHEDSRYWYGRVLMVPDQREKPHDMLLPLETDSFSGYGLLFELQGMLFAMLAVFGASRVEWPFVRRISAPCCAWPRFRNKWPPTTSDPWAV